MMDELLLWLQGVDGPTAYAVLGLASLSEMLLPFLPGDSIAVFGIVMAVSAGYNVLGVYGALNLGGLLGGMIAFAAGRWIGADRERRIPRWLRGPRATAAMNAALGRLERQPRRFLLVHRFVPAARAFVFVGAGMAGLPAARTALFGVLGLAIFNGALLTLGWAAGASYEVLRGWLSTYSSIALIAVVIVAFVLLVRFFRRTPKAHEPPAKQDEDETH